MVAVLGARKHLGRFNIRQCYLSSVRTKMDQKAAWDEAFRQAIRSPEVIHELAEILAERLIREGVRVA